MEAYRKRIANNHKKLLEFAEELKKLGCQVFATTNAIRCRAYIDYLHVRKGDLSTYVGFAEVPYRWYIGNEFAMNKMEGIVRGIVMGETGYEIPFKPEEVLPYLRPGKKLESFYEEI